MNVEQLKKLLSMDQRERSEYLNDIKAPERLKTFGVLRCIDDHTKEEQLKTLDRLEKFLKNGFSVKTEDDQFDAGFKCGINFALRTLRDEKIKVKTFPRRHKNHWKKQQEDS